MVIPGCPYGAEECPKVSDLTKMVEKNGEELKKISDTVVRLDTSTKNISKLIGIAISVISVLIITIGVLKT